MSERGCQPHPINSCNNVNNDGPGRPQPSPTIAIKLKQCIILGKYSGSRLCTGEFFCRSKLVRCESSLDANETLYDQRIRKRTFWVHNSIQRTIMKFNLTLYLRVSPTRRRQKQCSVCSTSLKRLPELGSVSSMSLTHSSALSLPYRTINRTK